jgi:hypothetical protein
MLDSLRSELKETKSMLDFESSSAFAASNNLEPSLESEISNRRANHTLLDSLRVELAEIGSDLDSESSSDRASHLETKSNVESVKFEDRRLTGDSETSEHGSFNSPTSVFEFSPSSSPASSVYRAPSPIVQQYDPPVSSEFSIRVVRAGSP